MVGIPARPVDRAVHKPRFDAYGTPDDPCLDPLLHEIDILRGELTDFENRVAKLQRDRIF